MLSILLIFHVDISGNEINEEQFLNNAPISIVLDKSHFDISGNDFNDEQS